MIWAQDGREIIPGKEVLWGTTKKGLSMNDFTTEAQIQLNIICIRISFYMHMTVVRDIRDHMVAYILQNIFLNIGRLVISDMKYYRNHDGMHLLFPSLINEMCGENKGSGIPR